MRAKNICYLHEQRPEHILVVQWQLKRSSAAYEKVMLAGTSIEDKQKRKNNHVQ